MRVLLAVGQDIMPTGQSLSSVAAADPRKAAAARTIEVYIGEENVTNAR